MPLVFSSSWNGCDLKETVTTFAFLTAVVGPEDCKRPEGLLRGNPDLHLQHCNPPKGSGGPVDRLKRGTFPCVKGL